VVLFSSLSKLKRKLFNYEETIQNVHFCKEASGLSAGQLCKCAQEFPFRKKYNPVPEVVKWYSVYIHRSSTADESQL